MRLCMHLTMDQTKHPCTSQNRWVCRGVQSPGTCKAALGKDRKWSSRRLGHATSPWNPFAAPPPRRPPSASFLTHIPYHIAVSGTCATE